MITIARDTRVLQSIQPLDLRTYLQSKGWELKVPVSTFGAAWALRRADLRAVEILVPETIEIDDYTTRVSEILATLERVEARPQPEIFLDIVNSHADVVRVRSTSEDTSDGTIRLDDGVRLVKSARDLFSDAASSAKEPKPVYTSRRPEHVTTFLDRSRLGQSERGSYVITLLTRLTPPSNEPLFPGLNDPFERVVTRTLAEALQTVRNGAEDALSTGDITPLTRAYRQGVSANFCDALVEMSGPKQHAIDISFSWSPVYKIPENVLGHVEIRPEHIPIIAEVAQRLRDTTPLGDFPLVGVVIGLQRAEGEAIGRITVLGFVDGRPRRVYIELGGDDYGEAGRAHINRAPVSCVGELVKLGRAYVLKNIRSFTVTSIDAPNGE